MRRMRGIYRRRRDALLDGLARELPELEPRGASAGLHVLADLPAGTNETARLRATADAGVGLTGASETYAWDARPGIVFGYGAITERHIPEALHRVRGVILES